MTVYYSTSGTAGIGEDHDLFAMDSVVIPAGSNNAKIIVTPIDDIDVEGDGETVVLTLAPSGEYAADAAAQQTSATIDDDDDLVLPVVSVTTTDTQADENGTDLAEFTIWLDSPLAEPLTIYYSFAGGSAVEDRDFIGDSGEVTLQPGQTSATITISPIDDQAIEGDEDVVLNLYAMPEYLLDHDLAEATATIADDDLRTASVAASDASASEYGGDAGEFTISLDAPASVELTVNYSVSGTATAGSDFESLAGSLTFGVGESSATVTITPIDDASTEVSETVVLTLSAGTEYTVDLANDQATLVIADNDGSPLLLEPETWLAMSQSEIDSVPPAISTELLAPFVNQAISVWAGTSLANASLQLLRNVEFRVGDLPANMLGVATAGHVIIDVNAGGVGWITSLTKTPNWGVDLLTTIVHELGHQLGLPDNYVEGSTDIMTGTLSVNTRRLPTGKKRFQEPKTELMGGGIYLPYWGKSGRWILPKRLATHTQISL